MKKCPKCAQDIPDSAIRCHYCQADLKSKTIGQRILGLRDYVALPTAVLALVAALYTPIAETVRGWLRLDGANIFGYLLNPDIVNVGLDDRSADKRVKEVTEYEPLLRVLLINRGHALTTLMSNFVCTGKQENDSRMVFTFSFYDPKSQVKQYPELAAAASSTFFGRLSDAQPYTTAERPAAGPSKCSFSYYDKYGGKQFLMDITAGQEKTLLGLVH